MLFSGMTSHLWVIGGYLLATIGIAHMLRQRRSPASTVAWLLTFVMLPHVGVVLYLTFGGRKLKQARSRNLIPGFHDRNQVPLAEAHEHDRILRNYGIPGASFGNQVTLCTNGQQAYRCLTTLIDEANDSIFVSIFIFARDATAIGILQRLTERAKMGVDVRVLVDGFGSFKTPKSFFRPLVDAGGQFAVFKPTLHIPFRTRTNLRNHRKIVVADGSRAFVGGMNITSEDIFAEATSAAWQDLGMSVRGPAAGHYESIFRSDWQFATAGSAPLDAASDSHGGVCPGNAVVQVLPSGPDLEDDPMYAITLASIYRASERVWIATPYFVPNDSIAEAIVMACQRNVDVRILVPLHSNHRLTDLAREPWLRDIDRAGGTILRYTKGMMHGKAMVVDDDFSMVGSANMDMRSLFLNYEVMQICYSTDDINAVAKWFEGLANDCRSDAHQQTFLGGLTEGLIRIVSPLF